MEPDTDEPYVSSFASAMFPARGAAHVYPLHVPVTALQLRGAHCAPRGASESNGSFLLRSHLHRGRGAPARFLGVHIVMPYAAGSTPFYRVNQLPHPAQ